MSRLLDGSLEFRKKNITRNIYDKNDYYNIGHSRALSDGDEWGKGRLNSSVGSLTDINKRSELTAKNKFNSNNQYNSETA